MDRTTAQRVERDLEFIKSLQQKLFAGSFDYKIQVVAKADQVTQNKVGRIVEIALMATEASNDLLKQDVGAKAPGQTSKANTVTIESGRARR